MYLTLLRSVLTIGIVLGVLSGTVRAHGFGSRFEIALPMWLFLAGGAGVVLVSFVIVSLFAGSDRGKYTYEATPLDATPFRVVSSPVPVAAARVGAVGLLVVGLLSGVFGPPDFNENLLPNLVWVGWWVGYTFTVIFIGNTWPVVNPWKTTYEWVARAAGREPSLGREYRFGNGPLVVGFLVFAWLEVIAPVSESPRWLAAIVTGYSVYLWAGMVVYGKDVWLREADPFTRLYRYLGKFAPLSPQNGGELRKYGVGLVPDDESLYRPGALTFLVAVLYTVTFDGFIATPEWRELALAAPRFPVPYLTSTMLLLLGLGVFVAAYLTIAWLIKLAAGERVDTLTVGRRFALSLLPIAIVYQVAHFYPFLLTQGQFLVLAMMDPFGQGWTVLGLAGFEPTTELPLLSVRLVWRSQVALIIIGHIVAVWVAHQIALDAFTDRWRATKSQLPMMGLMVIYTMVSLWMLTRPVIEPPLP